MAVIDLDEPSAVSLAELRRGPVGARIGSYTGRPRRSDAEHARPRALRSVLRVGVHRVLRITIHRPLGEGKAAENLGFGGKRRNLVDHPVAPDSAWRSQQALDETSAIAEPDHESPHDRVVVLRRGRSPRAPAADARKGSSKPQAGKSDQLLGRPESARTGTRFDAKPVLID